MTDGGMTFDTFLFKGRVLAVGGAVGPFPAGPAPAGAVGGELFAVLEHELGVQELAGHHGSGPVFLTGLGPGHLGDDGAVGPGRSLAAAGRLDGDVIAQDDAHAFPVQTVGNGDHRPVFKTFRDLEAIGGGGRFLFLRDSRRRAQAEQAQGGQQGGKLHVEPP